MKKILFPTLLAGALLMAACDTKTCYCYNYSSVGYAPTESQEYVGSDQACQAINRGTAGNPGSRVCVESNERIDPSRLVYKK
ncbi:MAG: hypothetical protein IJV22_05885 [Bacteroidales bacterium]|nr:hypothetical protein [Bacteroidales bacterium]